MRGPEAAELPFQSGARTPPPAPNPSCLPGPLAPRLGRAALPGPRPPAPPKPCSLPAPRPPASATLLRLSARPHDPTSPCPHVPTAGGSAGSTSVPGAAQHSSEARGLGTRQGRGGLPNPFRERQGDTHPALSGSPVGPAFRQQAAPRRDGPILPRSYVPEPRPPGLRKGPFGEKQVTKSQWGP